MYFRSGSPWSNFPKDRTRCRLHWRHECDWEIYWLHCGSRPIWKGVSNLPHHLQGSGKDYVKYKRRARWRTFKRTSFMLTAAPCFSPYVCHSLSWVCRCCEVKFEKMPFLWKKSQSLQDICRLFKEGARFEGTCLQAGQGTFKFYFTRQSGQKVPRPGPRTPLCSTVAVTLLIGLWWLCYSY
jgi:hypothetical protein